ncbi:MAG: carbohydrate-binding domain-containing protein [Spirochaetales bacterium]|nr:carbohydrate-binding domain-containing protein [Spirochaetales bacterium]
MLSAGFLLIILLTSPADASEASLPPLLKRSEQFTTRDRNQTPDLSAAVPVYLESGQNTEIRREGIYLLKGDYRNTTVIIDADNRTHKIQLILDSLVISNRNAPAIYVKSADKVFLTTINSRNSLTVEEPFLPDGTTNTDAVIFSRSDLTLNGKGTLQIRSVGGNGISSKDDLKITSGTYVINAESDGLEANDSIRIAGGELTINAGADALHSENEEDHSLGYIYIYDGELNLKAGDDAIRANSFIQIDGGRISISDSYKGLEATRIRINGGTLAIYSSDDGINVTAKTPGTVILEIYGGDISVEVGSGDTDAFDANGDFSLLGGTIRITSPRSAFDVDGRVRYTGGRVIINGKTVDALPITSRGPGSLRYVEKSGG